MTFCNKHSERWYAIGAIAVLVLFGSLVCLGAFVWAPGLHDNDWPLLMWLARHAFQGDLSALAIGHYGPAQLVLVAILMPLFGSTLVAAKVMNCVASLGILLLAGETARGVRGSARIRFFTILGLAVVPALSCTAQSEFGDPLATFFFMGSLWSLSRVADGSKQAVFFAAVAGCCMGCAGLFRVQFQMYGILATLAASLMIFKIFNASRLRIIGALWLGMLGAALPGMLLTLHVHRTVFSPVAPYFIGEAVVGYDPLDFAATYNMHSASDVIVHHLPALVSKIMYQLNMTKRLWLSLIVLGSFLYFRARKKWDQSMLMDLLILVLAAAYLLLLLPGWTIKFRHLLPFMACILIPACRTFDWLLAQKKRRRAWMFVFVFLVTAGAGYSVVDWQKDLADSISMNRANSELNAVLVQHGFANPGAVFVFNWNRWTKKDPWLTPFYNFGGWNLLCPAFNNERPNPIAQAHDIRKFAGFMEMRKVECIVWQKGLARFPELRDAFERTRTVPGYRFLAELPGDIIYENEVRLIR
jgi:hypothetical protein